MRRFIKMLVIVVIFQAGIYLYLDQVVLVPFTKFSQQSIADRTKFPVDLQKISTDKKYYVKLQTNNALFYTADNKLVKRIALRVKESITYFSWVPNTDVALIGISINTSHSTSVILKPVNLETNSLPQEPKINGLPPGSKIENVAFSPQTNVTYILVRGKHTASVYRTDANNRLRKILSKSSIQRIAVLQSEDMLLYDSKQTGAVYALNNHGKRLMVSPRAGQYALIGTDKDNNIYIGRLSGSGAVSTILKGTVNRVFAEYKALNYAYPVASVTINYDGKLRLI